MGNLSVRKGFLYLLIASVSVSALLGIAVIIIGNLGELEGKILATSGTITAVSILGLACGVFLESGRGKIVPLTGIAFAVIAGVLGIIAIWAEGDSEFLGKSLMSSTLLAFALSLTSLLCLARLDKRFSWALPAVQALIAAMCVFVLALIWAEFEPAEWLQRTMAVVGILISALTVTIPVFHRLSIHERTDEDIDAEIAKLQARIGELENSRR